jgi:hypothetical protein
MEPSQPSTPNLNPSPEEQAEVAHARNRLNWDGGEVKVSQCSGCVHKARGAAACAAFPSSIPRAILSNVFDHRQAHPDDMGIRWTPKPGAVSPFDRPSQ